MKRLEGFEGNLDYYAVAMAQAKKHPWNQGRFGRRYPWRGLGSSWVCGCRSWDTREWTAPGKEQRPHGQTVRRSLDSGQGSQVVCGGESKGGGECGPKPRPCLGPAIALGTCNEHNSSVTLEGLPIKYFGFPDVGGRVIASPPCKALLTRQAELPPFIGLELIKMGKKI